VIDVGVQWLPRVFFLRLGSSVCFCVLAGWFWVLDMLCTLTDSPQWCWEASLSSTSSSTTFRISSRSESCSIFTQMVERLPGGQSRQELIDCLRRAGTPSDVADLALSPFPPHPPGVVLPPHPHPNLLGEQLHQPGPQPRKLCQQQQLVELHGHLSLLSTRSSSSRSSSSSSSRSRSRKRMTMMRSSVKG